MSELIIFDELIKSNNFNMELRKNLKLNKTELAALYKQMKTINADRDSLL